MSTMLLNEMMGYEGKGPPPGMRTYTDLEGGTSLSYQLNMTVSARVDNLGSEAERNLVAFMKNTLGYSECKIDKQNNTIYVESITGVNSSWILEYIKNHIDANARKAKKGRAARRQNG